MCTEKISTKSVKINNDKYEYYIAYAHDSKIMEKK